MKKLFFLCIFLSISLHSNIFSQPKWEKIYEIDDYRPFWKIDLSSYNGKDIVLCGNYYFEGPFIIVSNDSGKTWNYTLSDIQVKLPNGDYYLPEEAKALVYPDSSLCLIACDSGYFWRSTDNAQTWERTQYPDIYRPNQVKFWNNKSGVMTVLTQEKNKGRTYKTDDGGFNWERFYIPESDTVESALIGLFDIAPLSKIIMLAYPENQFLPYRLKITNDFGKNIEFYNLPSRDIHKLYFINDKVGFWYGGIYEDPNNNVTKIIYRTQNGGKTWYNVLKDWEKGMSYIFDIHFCDSLNGIASGMTKIFRTSDGGEKWFVDTCFKYSEFQHYLGHVALLNPNVAIAVDDAIYRIDYSKTGSTVINTPKEIQINEIINADFIDLSKYINFETNQSINCSIYDYNGKLCTTELLTKSIINLVNLESGIYFLLITDNDIEYKFKFNYQK